MSVQFLAPQIAHHQHVQTRLMTDAAIILFG
jgi:hypothetical protein